MTIKIYSDFVQGRASWGILAIRLVFGLGIAQHGWTKIQHPSVWMGPDSPVPRILQGLAAFSEFAGGLALILGLFTPLALMGLAITMIVAITTVHLKAGDPFVALHGGRSFELAALYLAVFVMVLLAGPGHASLDAFLFGQSRGKPAADRSVAFALAKDAPYES